MDALSRCLSCQAAVGSLGVPEGRTAFLELPAKLPQLKYVGFGVTEAGLHAHTRVIQDLAEFLQQTFKAIPSMET